MYCVSIPYRKYEKEEEEWLTPKEFWFPSLIGSMKRDIRYMGNGSPVRFPSLIGSMKSPSAQARAVSYKGFHPL